MIELSARNEASRHSFTLRKLLSKGVYRLDRKLQARGGIFCYTSDPECLFRLSLTQLKTSTVLNAETTLPGGAVVGELHIWNEQLPALSEHVSLIAWALTISRRLAHSLRLLSTYMAERPELNCVCALRAHMALGTNDMTERLISLSSRFGFVQASKPYGAASLARRFGENILIAMLLLARDAKVFRVSTLWRARVPVFMPRDVLDRRFGSGACNTPDKAEGSTISQGGSLCSQSGARSHA